MAVLVVLNGKLLLPNCSDPQCGDVICKDGVIDSIQIPSLGKEEYVSKFDGSNTEIIDATGRIVMPGMVDSHVHVNEPGRSNWEGFWTATRAAIAGGITTIIDMPLNSIPPTTTVENLKTKVAAATGKCFCDVGFLGGIVPDNCQTQEIVDMVDHGVVGFKSFLIHSGVDEFPSVSKDQVKAAIDILGTADTVYMFHAEQEIGCCTGGSSARGAEYETFLQSRPKEMENVAVEMVRESCTASGVPCHIVHVSSSGVLDSLRAAQKEGKRLTAETCTHYLHFASESIDNNRTEFKCCPPIREKENQEMLWSALLENEAPLQTVVSDHSPCEPNLKEGDFMQAWGGIAGLQISLPALWKEMQSRSIPLNMLLKWKCEETAKLVGLSHKKGRIAVGMDADLCIWDPTADVEITKDWILHKHPVSPYLGETLVGKVEHTILRGELLYSEGRFLKDVPTGKFVHRATAMKAHWLQG